MIQLTTPHPLRGYFSQKLSEISEMFDGELKLISKSNQVLDNIPDYIKLGRHTAWENEPAVSPGLELVYQTEQTDDMLVVYVTLLYKLNVRGSKYPHNLIVGADFEKHRLKELIARDFDDEADVTPFLFAVSFADANKKFRFDQISRLREGSDLGELMQELDRIRYTA